MKVHSGTSGTLRYPYPYSFVSFFQQWITFYDAEFRRAVASTINKYCNQDARAIQECLVVGYVALIIQVSTHISIWSLYHLVKSVKRVGGVFVHHPCRAFREPTDLV